MLDLRGNLGIHRRGKNLWYGGRYVGTTATSTWPRREDQFSPINELDVDISRANMCLYIVFCVFLFF